VNYFIGTSLVVYPDTDLKKLCVFFFCQKRTSPSLGLTAPFMLQMFREVVEGIVEEIHSLTITPPPPPTII
jgi:hypothetical protein